MPKAPQQKRSALRGRPYPYKTNDTAQSTSATSTAATFTFTMNAAQTYAQTTDQQEVVSWTLLHGYCWTFKFMFYFVLSFFRNTMD